MITTNERLNKIVGRRKELDAKATEKQEQRRMVIENCNSAFKNLAPRISDLIKICTCLLENNISIGIRTKDIIGYNEEFVTDGVRHGLGFYFRYNNGTRTLIGIGIEGGGACGHDLAVDENGNIVVNPLNKVIGLWTYDDAYNDFYRKCQRFFEYFDSFEKRVFDYVDNL